MDSGTSACFIDIDFAKLHNFDFIKKTYLVQVGVVDGCPLATREVIHETKPLKVVLEDLISHVFSIIRSRSTYVILGLPWFEIHNRHIDWKI